MLSVEILDSSRVKIVDVIRKKGNIVVKSLSEADTEAINRKKNLILTFSSPDLDINTVFLPNIKDTKTKELIARNRLNIKEKNTIIQIVENPQIKQNGQIQHYVYSLPLDSIPHIDFEKADILTLSQIAIFNLSKSVSKDMYIYHCFSDEEKLVLTVSKDNILIYTRLIEIPEEEKANPVNFLYENINLTYHYILQNKAKQIDLILLTGNIVNLEEINGLIYNFSKIPIANIYYKSFVKGIEFEDFNRFVIPIGAVLTEETYNFLPIEFKRKKAFEKTVKYLQGAVVLGILITVFLSYYKILNIENNFNTIHRINTQIIKEQENILKSIQIDLEDIHYFENYITQKQTASKTHPFYFLNRLKNLLSITGVDEISYKKPENAGYFTLSIKSEKKFSTFSEFNGYIQMYQDMVNKMKGEFDINDKSTFDSENLTVSIELQLIQNVL